MGEFINFLYHWQQLIGSLGGGIIAIGGSIWLSRHLNTKSERRKQYANLLLVLQDIKRFIGKCELYLNWAIKKGVPYDKIILNDKINYFEPAQVLGLGNEVYDSIDSIYSIANVISYSFKLSEVLEIRVKKKKNEEIHTQKNIVSGKHWETLNLVKFYFKGIYKDYNIIAREVKKLSQRYKYLKVTNISLYKKNYVEEKIKEYGLNEVK